MSTIIVTGLPCDAANWSPLAGPETTVLPFAGMMAGAASPGFRALAHQLVAEIERRRPETIMAHDLGVTTTILALLMQKKRHGHLPANLIVFNGAWSGFDVLKARHPFRIQFASRRSFGRLLGDLGVQPDPRTLQQLPQLKALYRQIIAGSLMTRAARLVGRAQPRPLNLPVRVLMIAGADDPYIPMSAMLELQQVLGGCSLKTLYRGHFPYQGDCAAIRREIEAFIRAK